MWIVRVALDRPYTFIVLAVLILVLSPIMILRTPTDIFPNINIPVIAVAAVRPSGFWAVGPALAETPFDAGRRRATSESARANYDAAVATYRQTSLTAFQEVEDNVAALRILENETQQQQQAVASSQESLQLFTNRYKGGVDTYLQVITAQTIELANERNAIDILRRRLDASVLLIKALGGGWNVSNLPTFGASSVRDY
jgi:outer membrane protein TolC